jgi:hypothetical protein
VTLDHSTIADSRGSGMTEPTIAALIAIGVVAVTLLGVLRLMRPRQVVLPDYPELPAPPKEEGGGVSL